MFVLSTVVLYLSAFQVPSIETRGAVSPAVLTEQRSSWVFSTHLTPVELSFEGVPEHVLKCKSQIQLISGVILARLLSCCGSDQASAAINSFPRKLHARSLRVNEAIILSSLFP